MTQETNVDRSLEDLFTKKVDFKNRTKVTTEEIATFQNVLLGLFRQMGQRPTGELAESWKDEVMTLYRTLKALKEDAQNHLLVLGKQDPDRDRMEELIWKIDNTNSLLSTDISQNQTVFKALREFKEYLDRK